MEHFLELPAFRAPTEVDENRSKQRRAMADDILRSTMQLCRATTEASRDRGRRMSICARPDSVVVEVPNERVGLSLIKHLARLHAELSPIDAQRCCVRVELKEQSLEALIDILKRVSRWQACVGVQTLRAHIGGHVYTLSPS